MTKKKTKSKKIVSVIAIIFVVLLLVVGLILFYNVRYPINYEGLILNYSKMYNLDEKLVASLINEESSFDPNAMSKTGAVGLMQILPQTAEYIAENLDEEFSYEMLFDPETNIKYGCYYLDYLRNKFEDLKTYLSAYNAGEKTVSLWLANKDISSDGEKLDNIPYAATKNYVSRILKGERHYIGRIK